MIPLTKPLLEAAEAEAAGAAVLSGWVTQGPQVAAFEEEFAAAVGAAHACAVSNCTTALHLALLVAGVRPGDEVIVVSHTFIATANAITYCGAVPVFVDIDPATFNMDPLALARAVTLRTRAILCVHQMGMPCELPAILEIARAHGLIVVEDAACAIGSEIRMDGEWQRIGRPHGDLACFSFHPRKVITTGDGGMITTGNPEWAHRLRLLRQHGMSVPDTLRHASPVVTFEDYPVLGYNYRMTDIQAAVGRQQLKRLPDIVKARRGLAAAYHAMLKDVPGVVTPEEPEWARSNWQSYCVRLRDGFDQRMVMQKMLDRGVASRRGIQCIHREAPYRGATRRFPLPHSEQAQDRGLILPLYPQMTRSEQEEVVATLREAVS